MPSTHGIQGRACRSAGLLLIAVLVPFLLLAEPRAPSRAPLGDAPLPAALAALVTEARERT